MTIGVGILAFNRPQYLRRLIGSLEAQADLSDCDFHLFLDGATNQISGVQYAYQKDIDACERLFALSSLPNKHIYKQEHNVNIGIASLDATDALAASCEQIMQLEDDVVLSPHWFRLARNLYDELEEHPDVYSFNPGFRRIGTHAEDAANMGRVAYTWSHMWCECFTADRWRRIRPLYMEYHAYITEADYIERKDGPVRDFFDGLGMREGLACSQDGGREMAIRRNGMRRAQCAVNRALGIGLHGIHFTPELFYEMEFDKQTPFIFRDDATRKGFDWDD